MIIGGSVCALVALASVFVAWQFVHSAARADGRVIQMVERDGEHGKMYAPVFVFRDASGVEHTVHSQTASYPPEHQVGDTVRVLYSLGSPQDAKTDRFFSLWGWPLVTGLLAVFYLPLGLLVWHWPGIVQRFRNASPVTNAEAIRQATQTITQIAQVTEDKAMYDSREKAIRDQQWLLNASRQEGVIEGEIKGEIKGKIEGKIKMIRMLQEILNLPVGTDSDFEGKTLEQLQSQTADLQDRLRNRGVS